ncbi:MAG: amino acid ABC transporter substrate-binding protein, partial [Pseudomonadales bacterium]|nr:amino acid ABC transporter substrate-binding protein [Pseudomonadales bacterium]
MRYVLAICLAIAAATALANDRTDYIVSPENKGLGLPFSDAVRVGDMIYLSGTLGVEPGTMKLV